LVGIAVVVGRRAPGGAYVARARAAVALTQPRGHAEHLRALLLRHRLQNAVGRDERARVRARAGLAAQRVVDTGLAEVVEPAGEVDRVGPRVGQLGHRLLQRLRRAGQRALARLAVALDGAERYVAQRHERPRRLD